MLKKLFCLRMNLIGSTGGHIQFSEGGNAATFLQQINASQYLLPAAIGTYLTLQSYYNFLSVINVFDHCSVSVNLKFFCAEREST